VLAVRITRSGWEKALSLAALTSFDRSIFRSPDEWEKQFRATPVHLQWDTERSLRAAALPYYSIQVGLSRHIIVEYVEQWVKGIEDLTPRVRKMYDLLQSGQGEKAKKLLPPEKVYPVRSELARRLLIRG
jgi:hypothetical protein